MFQQYTYKSSNNKYNAQENLQGRSPYVDNATLRYHHARINAAYPIADGLLFYLRESVALDPDNMKREHRVVIFDLFGNVIYSPDLDDCFTTGEQARQAGEEWLKTINIGISSSIGDAAQINREAADRERRYQNKQIDYALDMIEELAQ